MRIDPAGWPFVAPAFILTGIVAWLGGVVVAISPLVLALVLLFFFRDPERHAPNDPAAVVSPADGRVLVAGPAQRGVAPPGEWLQVSVFLSPLDVHVNRIPAAGRVTNVTYRPGRYMAAYRPEAAGSNESSEVWIDHDGQPVVFRQVVGLLARRVVCRLEPGRLVAAGDRFGVMKFGSRMDVFLPLTAALCVTVGEQVKGGETVIARLPAGDSGRNVNTVRQQQR
jgi:phosphatidylserine decarboxylase